MLCSRLCSPSNCISYRDHITNEEVKARIGNAIGPYEDLLTSVKQWTGNIKEWTLR